MAVFNMLDATGQLEEEDVASALEWMALGVSLTPLEEDDSQHDYIVQPITDLTNGPLPEIPGCSFLPGQVPLLSLSIYLSISLSLSLSIYIYIYRSLEGLVTCCLSLARCGRYTRRAPSAQARFLTPNL